MAKVAITEAAIYSGDAYVENSEDGPSTAIDHFAAVITVDGVEYRHLVPFRHPRDSRLEELVERIRAAMVIDTDHWVELAPRIPLEERLALYAEREAMVRQGWMVEEDMYHGIA